MRDYGSAGISDGDITANCSIGFDIVRGYVDGMAENLEQAGEERKSYMRWWMRAAMVLALLPFYFLTMPFVLKAAIEGWISFSYYESYSAPLEWACERLKLLDRLDDAYFELFPPDWW